MEALLARSNEIAPGTMRAVQVGTRNLLLFRDKDGAFYCLENRCSHADVALSEGCFEGHEITCSAHGARFDVRSGKNLCMPAVRPVKNYPVLERDGQVFVSLPE